MKSQLLQDINDGTSVAAASPAAQRAEPEAPARSRSPEPAPEPAQAGASPFASDRVDWQGAPAESPPHWFDRWGRRAAGWSIGLVLASLVAGGGLWLYRETKLENTLVLVAKNSVPTLRAPPPPVTPATAARAPAAPSAPTSAPIPEPDALPDRTAAASALAASPAPEPVAPKPLQARHRLVSTLAHSKTPTPTVDPEAAPTRQLADTLRQCRALGYHAAQCLKRGCAMTRYGLACKG